MLQATNLVQLVLLLPAVVLSIDLKTEYKHSAYMDPEEKYQLHWNVFRDTKLIKFAVQVNITQGWIGFGISKGLSGKMMDADLAIGWFSGGKGYLKDRHGIGNTRPKLDSQQDYILTESMQIGGQTILKFERKFITCDPNDQHIKEGTVKVMWAYNAANTPTSSDETTLLYHGIKTRGSRSINLMAYGTNTPRQAGAKYFDFIAKNVIVPSDHTTYWCTPFKIPDHINTKHHMIEIEPVIQPGNEALVHHIVIYECESNFNESHLNTSGKCTDAAMPAHIKQCKGGSSVYAWAIGGTNFRLPKHVGLPIGIPGTIKYLVMETHYDNPGRLSGQKDNSGLRFYYTNQTRQYDGATIFVGYTPNRMALIPPGEKNFTQESFCTSELTKGLNTSLSDNSIRIFASFPHAHTAGTAIWTKHIRNGKELPEIIRDDTYDFNYQQTYLLPKEIKFLPGSLNLVYLLPDNMALIIVISTGDFQIRWNVLPLSFSEGENGKWPLGGDSMYTYCRYDTSNRTKATTGGESTNEEMCLNFLLYYPRTDIAQCLSYANRDAINKFAVKYARFPYWWAAKHPKYKSAWVANWTGVAWNDSMKDELHKIYKNDKVEEFVRFLGPKQPIIWEGKKPTIQTPLVVDDPCYKPPISSGVMIYLSMVLLLIPIVVSWKLI